MVISDPKNPENEGRTFLFKYGKKIFDKITLLMNPEFEGDKPVNPFDMWNGTNFKIRIRTVDGYPNYDQSIFAEPAPVSDDDAKLEKIWKSEHSLKEFLEPKNFKSYEELKRKLEDVLGLNAQESAPAPQKKKVVVEDETETPPFSVDEDDDDLAAFKALAD
jgi:hypothetical protein